MITPFPVSQVPFPPMSEQEQHSKFDRRELDSRELSQAFGHDSEPLCQMNPAGLLKLFTQLRDLDISQES